jgi:hypothetical protein
VPRFEYKATVPLAAAVEHDVKVRAAIDEAVANAAGTDLRITRENDADLEVAFRLDAATVDAAHAAGDRAVRVVFDCPLESGVSGWTDNP